MRVLAVLTVIALAGCWLWWLEEDRWCRAMSEAASPSGKFFCLPLSPFVALAVILICVGIFIRMKIRDAKH